MATEIPIVDLSADDAPDALLSAYSTAGFAQVVGHGIERELIETIFDAGRRFHGLPLQSKMAVEVNQLHRGYLPLASSTDRASELGEATRPNQSESFMVMGEESLDPDVYLQGPNQWPRLVGFRPAVEAYHAALSALGRTVIQRFADALGDDGTLLSAFERPTTWLRLLHYPTQLEATPHDMYGSAPHTDFGAITILAQDDVGGLQVRNEDGTWIDVPPQPGAFVMNTGEMMKRWSDRLLKATPHRVVNRSGRQRFSVPFFFDPHMTTIVSPLRSCCGPDTRCGPIDFGAYVRAQLEAGYDHYDSGPD